MSTLGFELMPPKFYPDVITIRGRNYMKDYDALDERLRTLCSRKTGGQLLGPEGMMNMAENKIIIVAAIAETVHNSFSVTLREVQPNRALNFTLFRYFNKIVFTARIRGKEKVIVSVSLSVHTPGRTPSPSHNTATAMSFLGVPQ